MWIEFEGRIIPMEWGTNVYTVLTIPQDVSTTLIGQNAKRVEVELNDHVFNMALTKAPVIDGLFVYTGKQVLSDADIEPHMELDIRIRKTDPDIVETPTDVMQAMRENDLTAVWEGLTPGRKRGMLHTVTSAKRPETRRARIEKLIETLAE
ncbi:MAG: YdeI/OmpD-associated family protein [Pseudomonadota bacterium]